MKQPQEALSILIRAFLVLIMALFIGTFAAAVIAKPKQNDVIHDQSLRAVKYGTNSAKLLARGTVTFTNGEMPKSTNWRTVKLPNRHLELSKIPSEKGFNTAWVKVSFARSELPPGFLGFVTDFSYGKLQIFLNGSDIYRNYSAPEQNLYYWNRPQYSEIPNLALKEQNELLLRIEPDNAKRQSIGYFVIGQDSFISNLFRIRDQVDRLAPQSINNLILAISILLLIFWSFRKTEYDFAWIAAAGFTFYFRNLHFYIENPIIAPEVFSEATNFIGILQIFLVLGFAGKFIQIPKFNNFLKLLVLAAIGLLISVWVSLLNTGASNSAQILCIIVILAFLSAMCFHVWKNPNFERFFMVSAIWFAGICLIHDFGMFSFKWIGLSFFLAPYSSIFVFSIFGLTLGRRLLFALSTIESVNLSLEKHIAEATENLRTSEEARRKLEISLALETERERIMGEIHDRIGSNLATTLAATKRKDSNSPAIPALKRAITDLKISVDSLEQIDGDIVALLANIRHRLELDVIEAGLKFIWKVEPVAKIDWLDSVVGLHILRILQEAISNIIVHSGGDSIEVRCSNAKLAHNDAILISISDNGKGFNLDEKLQGRGLSGMKSRARAIGAKLDIKSAPHKGTKLTLYLATNRP